MGGLRRAGGSKIGVSPRHKGSIVAWPTALDAPARLDRRSAFAAVHARCRGGQTAAAGPGTQLFHGLGGGYSDRNHVIGGLGQRHVEKRCQPAAGPDLGARPVGVIGPGLPFGNAKLTAVHLPDLIFLTAGRQVNEVDGIKSFCSGELGRQLGDVVASADKEDVGLVIRVG